MTPQNKFLELSPYGLITNFIGIDAIYPDALQVFMDDKESTGNERFTINLFFATSAQFSEVNQALKSADVNFAEFTDKELGAPSEYIVDEGLVMLRLLDHPISIWKGMPIHEDSIYSKKE
jgi:hypothetical protein